MTVSAQEAVTALAAAKSVEDLTAAIERSSFLDATPGDDRQKLRGALGEAKPCESRLATFVFCACDQDRCMPPPCSGSHPAEEDAEGGRGQEQRRGGRRQHPRRAEPPRQGGTAAACEQANLPFTAAGIQSWGQAAQCGSYSMGVAQLPSWVLPDHPAYPARRATTRASLRRWPRSTRNSTGASSGVWGVEREPGSGKRGCLQCSLPKSYTPSAPARPNAPNLAPCCSKPGGATVKPDDFYVLYG